MRRRTLWGVGLAVLVLVGATGCNGRGYSVCRADGLDAAPSARTLVVVDLDDTVVPSPAGPLHALLPLGPAPCPLRGAPAVLHRLSADHQILFLTARPALLAPGTLAWLDARGFPRAPVVFATTLLSSPAAQACYKAGVLSALAAKGWRTSWGIGDKASDLAAYGSVDARAVLILSCGCDPDGRGLPAESATLTVLRGQDAAWRRIDALVGAPPSAP